MSQLPQFRVVVFRLSPQPDRFQQVLGSGSCGRCGKLSYLDPCNACSGRFVRIVKRVPRPRVAPMR